MTHEPKQESNVYFLNDVTEAKQKESQKQIRLKTSVTGTNKQYLYKNTPTSGLEYFFPIDCSILVASAAKQRHAFLSRHLEIDPIETESLRKTIIHQHQSLFVEEPLPFPVDQNGLIQSIHDELLVVMDKQPASLLPEDVSLNAFDETLRMACEIRHGLDEEAVWYWQSDYQLAEGIKFQNDNSKIETEDQRKIADSIRRAAIETLPATYICHHLHKALNWDLTESFHPSNTYTFNDVRKIMAILIDEVYVRSQTPESERDDQSLDQILYAAERAVELEE